MLREFTQLYTQDNGSDKVPVFRFKFAGNKVNRNGWQLNIDGVDTDSYMNNPVVLYNHNSEIPIAKTVNLVKQKRSLTGDIVFDQEDAFAVEIQRKVTQGFINAVSIGYIPTEREYIDADKYEDDWERMWMADERILKADMLETSIVTIPADSSALRVASTIEDDQKATLRIFMQTIQRNLERYNDD